MTGERHADGNGQDETAEQPAGGTNQNGLIYIYWSACKECGFTTAVHGAVRCSDCDEILVPYAIAGAVVDDEVRIRETWDNDDL